MTNTTKHDCDKCDSCGGEKTFSNQVSMPINGRVQCIDWCIHHIVASLNAGNIRTVASCCGHGAMDGNILLEDGRALIVLSKEKALKWLDKTVKTAADDFFCKKGVDNCTLPFCDCPKE